MKTSVVKVGNKHMLMLSKPLLRRARLKVGDLVNLELHEDYMISLTPLNSRSFIKKPSRTIGRLTRTKSHPK